MGRSYLSIHEARRQINETFEFHTVSQGTYLVQLKGVKSYRLWVARVKILMQVKKPTCLKGKPYSISTNGRHFIYSNIPEGQHIEVVGKNLRRIHPQYSIAFLKSFI
ncbi:hypothetical protein [Caldalkalibacillus salinus]|uniref:hypothetical protein n=1 Tax=Caldalkalibacillus salinus TaxID=2803787 RepID=UPI00192190C8|nr:hypothetical protein [Caldalkalibacillus salinus]